MPWMKSVPISGPRLEQPTQVQDLCHQLQRQYRVNPMTCEADVLALLNDMYENDLLSLVQ
ncbi:PqqD family peptide modification chaperone [bacterium]|nr:PqqD family peptide modification chaperone [bacterium]